VAARHAVVLNVFRRLYEDSASLIRWARRLRSRDR